MTEEVQRSLRLAGERIGDSVANFLPGALVLLILLIGSLVLALAVRYVLLRALQGVDLDARLQPLGVTFGDWTASRGASYLVASTVFWAILAIGLLLGLTALDAALPSRFATTVLEYVPHLIAAALILIVGAMIARFLATAVLIAAVNARFPWARLLGTGVKWLVLLVAVAMALDHLGIGRTVLLLAFGILFGGVVLALSLAVGLGSGDIVRRALERQVEASARSDKLDHV